MGVDINRRGPFREGERVQLIDRKGRVYLVDIADGNLFESHIGSYPTGELIGRDEGCRVATSRGHRLMAVRPTLSDLTLRMPRIATVMYPKDLAAMLDQSKASPKPKSAPPSALASPRRNPAPSTPSSAA